MAKVFQNFAWRANSMPSLAIAYKIDQGLSFHHVRRSPTNWFIEQVLDMIKGPSKAVTILSFS